MESPQARAEALRAFDRGEVKAHYSPDHVSCLMLAACEDVLERHECGRHIAFLQGVALGVMVSALAALALSCQPPPPPRESDAVHAPIAECGGATLDAIQVGNHAAVGYAKKDRFSTLEFINGEFVAARPDTLVSGGAPRLELRGDQVCAVGALEGDDCLSRLWRDGYCWTLKTPALATPSEADP